MRKDNKTNTEAEAVGCFRCDCSAAVRWCPISVTQDKGQRGREEGRKEGAADLTGCASVDILGARPPPPPPRHLGFQHSDVKYEAARKLSKSWNSSCAVRHSSQ